MNNELYLEYYAEFQEAFNTKPRDNAHVEMLYARYIQAWHRFEEQVFMQCKLPRHELMIKRFNHG